MKTNRLLWLICFFAILISPSFGQTFEADAAPYDTIGYKNRKNSAETIIEELKKGVLVVRLATNNQKISEMERMANSPEVDEKKRGRFKKWAEDTREDTRKENLLITNAFARNFTFTRLLFMPDTSVQQLKKGVKSGYFLNENLEPDPAASIGDEPWHIVWHNTSPREFVMLNGEFEEVKRPFPIPQIVETKRFLYIFKRGSLLKPVQGYLIPRTYFLDKETRELNRSLDKYTTIARKKSERYFFDIILWNHYLKKYHSKVTDAGSGF